MHAVIVGGHAGIDLQAGEADVFLWTHFRLQRKQLANLDHGWRSAERQRHLGRSAAQHAWASVTGGVGGGPRGKKSGKREPAERALRWNHRLIMLPKMVSPFL